MFSKEQGFLEEQRQDDEHDEHDLDRARHPGDNVKISYIRKGEQRQAEIELAERP